MKLTGKQTWEFENPLFVNSSGTAVGPKEKKVRLDTYLTKPMMKCTATRKTGRWQSAS